MRYLKLNWVVITAVLSKKKEGGLGFLISKEAQCSVLEWKAYTDRIISAKFLTLVSNLTVIQLRSLNGGSRRIFMTVLLRYSAV